MFTVDVGWLKVVKVIIMQYDISPIRLSLSLEQEEQVVLASLRKFKSNLILELHDNGLAWNDACDNAAMISAINQMMRYYGD